MAMKAAVPSVRLLKGYDIREEASKQFAQWASRELKIEAVAVGSAREAVVDSDMIATVTVANEPIVKDSWLKKGSFFAHVGSYQEEEEAVVFNADKVVVDLWHEVVHRGTPLLAKLYTAGKIKEDRIYANIGEIVRGKKPGRTSREERIFYLPVGIGKRGRGGGQSRIQESEREGSGSPA